MHASPHSPNVRGTLCLCLALGVVAALAGGCSSGGGSFVPPPIVAAPPPPPAPPPSVPEQPAGFPTGGSGPDTSGAAATPYTGSLSAEQLLVRSSMAYAESAAYADEGTITILQPSRRNEFAFQTLYERDGAFSFALRGPAASTLPHLEIHKVAKRFETIRSGSYGQAATLEGAIVPLQNLMTLYTTTVPRMLAGHNWGPTNDYHSARIVGVTSVNGQPAIMLELDLIHEGPATLWLDQATLLIRRMAHQSPRSEVFITVVFSRLERRE